MVTATSMLVCSPVASELYNITVTCVIHLASTADQCVVRAVDDDGVTRTGSYVYMLQVANYLWYSVNILLICTCIYVVTQG